MLFNASILLFKFIYFTDIKRDFILNLTLKETED